MDADGAAISQTRLSMCAPLAIQLRLTSKSRASARSDAAAGLLELDGHGSGRAVSPAFSDPFQFNECSLSSWVTPGNRAALTRGQRKAAIRFVDGVRAGAVLGSDQGGAEAEEQNKR